MSRFSVWFLASTAPVVALIGLLVDDVAHPISDAQIAMGAPEDTIGFGLLGLLTVLSFPLLLWLVFIWKAVRLAASPVQTALCFSNFLVAICAVGALLSNHLDLERRVFRVSQSGAQQTVPADGSASGGATLATLGVAEPTRWTAEKAK